MLLIHYIKFDKTGAIINGIDEFTVAQSSVCDIEDCHKLMSYPDKSIKIIHQNIRSIHRNFSDFQTLLDRSMTDWDFIILTECWLCNKPYLPSLEGYNISQTLNNATQNEGVVVFYKKTLRLVVSEPDLCGANCLMLNMGGNTTIVAIYRPPGYKDISQFVESLDKLFSEIHSTNKVLIGDINIDIMDNNQDINSSYYLNMLASHSLLPAHVLPTHNKTCLDHVMLKCSCPASCYVAETSITDHSL
jgi:hypothetical protein